MCGIEETIYSDHTYDKKSLLDAHPKDGVYGAGPSRMLGVGAHKKQQVMISHVGTDNPISHKYPPVIETCKLVKNVGVICNLVGEIDAPYISHCIVKRDACPKHAQTLQSRKLDEFTNRIRSA